ncbi:MAG: P-loop ATPase, Sll1717 family [Opitutaceae bacterium]
MKITEWIGVGSVSAERDDLLSEYFFDNGVLNAVINSRSRFLVLGRKGAGKTAIFKYLSENPNKFLKQDDLLISLSFEDYNWNVHSLLVNSDAAESLAYKQSWRFVILVETIKKCVQGFEEKQAPIPKALAKAKKLLEKIFGEPIPSIYTVIGKKLLSISKLKLPKAGVGLDAAELDRIEANAGEISFEAVRDDPTLQSHLSQSIDSIIRYLETAIEESKSDLPRVFIAFDRVDEAWDDISVESSKKVIAGLISAADSVTVALGEKIRPIVFLREDIFDVLSLNDSNKLREDCGALLHWERDSLFKLVLMRINYFASKANIQEFKEIDDLFDKKEMRQRTKPSNYILKRSMMRPRDAICFLNRVIGAMKDSEADPFNDAPDTIERLEAERIYEAEPGYSEWLKKEVLEEWSVQSPEIKVLFDSIQNNGSTNLTNEILAEEFKKLDRELNRVEVLKHMRFLFDNSIIGFKVGASNVWRYKCFYPSQGFVESDDYRIHDGLVRSLSLKEPRERE